MTIQEQGEIEDLCRNIRNKNIWECNHVSMLCTDYMHLASIVSNPLGW